MKEIGLVMGISESRVCQIHAKTLRRLQAYLEGLAAGGEQSAKEPPAAASSADGARCFE
jgi:hypothetical protein